MDVLVICKLDCELYRNHNRDPGPFPVRGRRGGGTRSFGSTTTRCCGSRASSRSTSSTRWARSRSAGNRWAAFSPSVPVSVGSGSASLFALFRWNSLRILLLRQRKGSERRLPQSREQVGCLFSLHSNPCQFLFAPFLALFILIVVNFFPLKQKKVTDSSGSLFHSPANRPAGFPVRSLLPPLPFRFVYAWFHAALTLCICVTWSGGAELRGGFGIAPSLLSRKHSYDEEPLCLGRKCRENEKLKSGEKAKPGRCAQGCKPALVDAKKLQQRCFFLTTTKRQINGVSFRK